jgi:uncharacterized membrane protein (UPF0127 family)
MHLSATNVATNTVIAERVTVARSKVERAVGLLKHSSLDDGAGLLILPCRGVHTCWMRFTIDVVALDATGRVVDVVSDMRPWRVRLPRRGAVSVLELPAGTIARSNTRPGDQIALRPSLPGLKTRPTYGSEALDSQGDVGRVLRPGGGPGARA